MGGRWDAESQSQLVNQNLQLAGPQDACKGQSGEGSDAPPSIFFPLCCCYPVCSCVDHYPGLAFSMGQL